MNVVHAKLISLLVFLNLSTAGFSEESFHNTILIDSFNSNVSSASILTTPYYYMYKPVEQLTTDDKASSATRFFSMLFLEAPLMMFSVFQHELGHAFRLRDTDGSVDHYEFTLPFPYRPIFQPEAGDKPLGRVVGSPDWTPSRVEENLFDIGGLEACQVHSKYLLEVALHNNRIDRSISNLYSVSKLQGVLYGKYRGVDVEGVTWQENVRQKQLLNALDPTVINAIGQNWNFLWKGSYEKNLKLFNPTADFGFLPYLSYYLIPYGEAYGLNSLLTAFNINFHLTIEKWDFLFPHVESPTKLHGFNTTAKLLDFPVSALNIKVTLRASYSKQPYSNSGTTRHLAPAKAAGLEIRHDFTENFGLTLSSVAKDKGYFPDLTIKSATTWGLGLDVAQF